MKENNPVAFNLSKEPWLHNSQSTWLASTVSLKRNVDKNKFPGKLSNDRRKQLIQLVGNELTSNSELKAPLLYRGEDLNPQDKELIVEHFLTTESFHQAHAGEALIITEDGLFLGVLNIGDHIHLRMIDCNGDLEAVWSQLVKLESSLSRKLNFAFSPKYGFLTADPTLCGTGLEVAVFLQTTALIHSGEIDAFLEKNADDDLAISGIQGNPTEVIGDVLMIKNNYTLGVTEENILSSLRTFTSKVLAEEAACKLKIKKEDNADIKDKVSRAYAILLHSYQIEAIEALNAISLIKLGVELGWIKGVEVVALNELFFNSRRGHLLRHFSGKVSQEEILHKRAEFIHKALKNVALTV